MNKNIKIALIITGLLSLTACKDNNNKTLYDFQAATDQAQKEYVKDKTKGFKSFFEQYNLDESYILSNAVIKYKREAILEASSSSGISDADKKADEKMKTIKIGDVIKEFDKNNPDAPAIRKSMTYKDGYTRDVPLAYATGQIAQGDLENLNKCFNEYRIKHVKINYQDIKKTQQELVKFNNTKVSTIMSQCAK